MAKHTVDVTDDTAGALEDALGRLRIAGMPATATVRVKARTALSPDGGPARALTARWADDDQPGSNASTITPATPSQIARDGVLTSATDS